LEESLSKAKKAWVNANKIGKTSTSWETEEAFIRKRHAELMALPEEERDQGVVEGSLEKTGMLQATLDHLNNVLIPAARAREEAEKRKRSNQRKKAKKKRGSK